MERVKVTKIILDVIHFDNGSYLESVHKSDCCEDHYLSTDDLTLKDFEGLEFDLSNDKFFERVENYGIRLVPIKGHPINIPGYGFNNGNYSSELNLVLTDKDGKTRVYDIEDCQDIQEYRSMI